MAFKQTQTGELVSLRITPQEVMDLIKTEKIEFVDLQFTDLPGRLQHVTVPSDQVQHDAFQVGLPKLDGSSIRGFTEIYDSDMLLKPDPSTFAIIPWIPQDIKTARMIVDVYWGFGHGRLSRDPRSIAQQAEKVLLEEGYDTSLWGPEIEFFVFDRVTWDVSSPHQGQSYKIESKEAAWTTTGTNYPIRFKEGYYPVPPQDTLTEFRSECVKTLRDSFHIVCDAHHHEVATAGQCEIDMYRDTLTSMADNVMTYKYAVKNIAHQRGMVATMMPKPIFGDNGSGMHSHVSLWKDSVNTFYDENDEYAELSQEGRYFAGGLLEHSRALTAITNPTTNSYRRLVPGYEAPVYIAWSRGNRSVNVRVPVYEKGRRAYGRKRLEFRTPDPSCNPYLCFAAMTAAGLDGVKRKIEPGDPVDENVYHLTAERKRELGIQELPESLKEAIDCLKTDNEFLKHIFPGDAIDMIIENASKEYSEVSMRPHPYEFHLYFDM